MKYKYTLQVAAGEYKSNNLFLLFCEVLIHRLYHLFHDKKWID